MSNQIISGSNNEIIITDALGNPMPKINRSEEIPMEKEFDGGLIKPDSMLKTDELLSTVLFVVSLGPDCYQDKQRFPNGAWCKPGDFVLVRPNAGTRIVIHGKEFRVINDDSVEAVVDDPRGITRKFV